MAALRYMSSSLSHAVPWGAQGNLWPSPGKLMRRVLSEERGGCCSPRPGCGYSRATRRGTSHPLNCRRFQPSQSTDPLQPAFALGSPVGVGIEGLAGEVESSCSHPREAMNLVHVCRISRRKPNCKANLRVRGITLSTQNCIQAGSCSQGGLGHINKHNSESSTLRTNFCHGPVTGTVTEISSRTEFVHFALCDAADVRELDAVVDAVGRGVGPDDGPDLADAGFEHSARHDTRNRRSGRSSAGASPAAAGPSHHC